MLKSNEIPASLATKTFQKHSPVGNKISLITISYSAPSLARITFSEQLIREIFHTSLTLAGGVVWFVSHPRRIEACRILARGGAGC